MKVEDAQAERTLQWIVQMIRADYGRCQSLDEIEHLATQPFMVDRADWDRAQAALPPTMQYTMAYPHPHFVVKGRPVTYWRGEAR